MCHGANDSKVPGKFSRCEFHGFRNKYYRIPASFAGKNLETLYADYLALLDEAKVEISRVRRTEDPVYESEINKLKEKLKSAE